MRHHSSAETTFAMDNGSDKLEEESNWNRKSNSNKIDNNPIGNRNYWFKKGIPTHDTTGHLPNWIGEKSENFFNTQYGIRILNIWQFFVASQIESTRHRNKCNVLK